MPDLVPDLDNPLFGSSEPANPREDYTPEHGEVVRLDDPELDGEARYALFVGEGLVVPLPGVQSYQLPVYPTG